jgi:hypothetical protein
MDTKQEDFDNMSTIRLEFESCKGQFVICKFSVLRLIGILEDEWDYYYILYDGRDVFYMTCLYVMTPLKSHIYDSHYQTMVRLAKMNHLDYTDEDIEGHKTEIEQKILEEGKIIFGLHWDLE